MRDVGASANADDEAENDRGLTATGDQNLIAQPGTQLSDRVPDNIPYEIDPPSTQH